MADNPDKARTEKVLSEGRTRFTWCETAERPQRELELDDRKFVGGAQWPEEIKAACEREGNPCHTVNRMRVFVKQVTNAQRQNRASGKVSPVDDKGDIKTAEIIMGCIRHIEYSSKAEVVYATGASDAVTSGRGYWIINPKYCNPFSNEREIELIRVRNPFQVYIDPNSQEPDASDAEFGFKITAMTQDEFKRAHPSAKMPGESEWETYNSNYPGWFAEKNIRIAEYYYKDYREDTVYSLRDGTFALKSRLGAEPNPEEVVFQRTTQVPQVKWCKMTATEVLEETVMPGSGNWIPIVRVIGEELDINGQVTYSGVIRDAKDAQREFNYMRSKRTQAIGLAPTAPWVMAEGQEEGHEAAFTNANRTNPPYLLYKPTSIEGKLVPAPQRQVAEPPIQALNQACLEASDDMKATTGVYDAQQGAKSNETSGLAINARVSQGETSNFHFVDNLTLSIGHSTRIILDWFGDIYDTKRVMRIIGEDDSHSTATILGKSVPQEQKQALMQDPQAKNKVFDISVGTYDVICSAGPSFATKRQQASAQLSDLARSYPQLMQVAGDLVVKSFDVPFAQEISDRIKMTLPPELQDKEEGAGDRLPPEVQQKMAQMQQEAEQHNAALEDAMKQLDELRQQAQAKTLELASRERMNSENNDIKVLLAEIAAHNTGAMELLRAEFDEIKSAIGHSRSLEMQASQPEPTQNGAGR